MGNQRSLTLLITGLATFSGRLVNLVSARYITVLSILMIATSQLQAQNEILKSSINETDFKNPPKENRIYTWWHWIDSYITKEGVTKDLEAMKKQGIYGATILNVNRFDGKLGNANVKFNTPEWYAMFKYALDEAKRLDMKIGVQNCDGWSTSGGPWITNETSMKEYVWRKTWISGGKAISVNLKKPIGNSNFYKDCKVVAYRSAKANSFDLASPTVNIEGKNNGESLIDGNPVSSVSIKTDQPIIIKFKVDFTTQTLLLHLQRVNSRHGNKQLSVFDIESSEDGITFKKVAQVTDTLLNETYLLPIPKTTAKVFRITFKEVLKSKGVKEVRISELALLKTGEVGSYQPAIYAHEAKTAAVSVNEMADFYSNRDMPGPAIIKSKTDVIDLTDKMQPDGKLNWNAPEGDWTVIRFGYTTTGKKNHPATKEGEGLECDKMDTAALNLHFKNFPQKLVEAAGSLKGSTFTYLFVDSWEALFQNWTVGFEKDFESRMGYSMMPYLPVLCGEVVESRARSEAFLHDFRKTIADLIEERYFKHLADLCHRQGLMFHAESIYGGAIYPPFDVLKAQKYFDVAMTEFWAPVNAADTPFLYNPKTKMTATLPMHGAFLYNKQLVASEAYTGFAMYSDSPWDIKLFGDNAFTEGVNRMVLHSYVHQPEEKKPGLTLGMYGLTFNRHNIWWPYASSFFDEQARVEYILQKGKIVSDVLVYAGDKYPYQEWDEKTAAILPGVRFNYLNADVLMSRITAKDGKLWMDKNTEFQLLLINDDQLELSTLKKIAELVKQGATVISPKPKATLSLKNYEDNNEQLKQLADQVWDKSNDRKSGFNQYGKGKVFWGSDVRFLLKENNFTPDVQIKGAKMDMLMYIHKKLDGQDAYYLVNKSNDKTVQLEATFRITGKAPAIWDVNNGNYQQCGLYTQNNNSTTLPLLLRPKQSVFVIFKDGGDKKHFVQLNDQTGKQLFPTQLSGTLPVLPDVVYEGEKLNVTAFDASQYSLITNTGAKSEIKTPAVKTIVLTAGATVTLEAEPSIKPFLINTFNSLTKSENPAIKYCSGVAAYEMIFTLPGDHTGTGKRIYIQLDQFGSTASISVNGTVNTTLWEPGYKTDITALVKTGVNKLNIKVTNPWRNRLIGDMIYPEKATTFTTSPFKENESLNVINKNSKLLNSGISTPIKILSVSTSVIDAIN